MTPPTAPVAARGKSSISHRAGLTFPCARVRSHMKELCFGHRVGAEAAVYMSAVLEYLVTEVLEIAGEEAKRKKRQRIAPSHLLETIRNDPDLCAMAQNVTFAHTGTSVRNPNDANFSMPPVSIGTGGGRAPPSGEDEDFDED